MAAQPFFSNNQSYQVAYTGTPGSLTLPPVAMVSIFNADSANVVLASVSYGNVVANVTTGQGTVVAPFNTQQLQLPVNGAPGNATVYVSVAGVSGSGNVWITTGNFDRVI